MHWDSVIRSRSNFHCHECRYTFRWWLQNVPGMILFLRNTKQFYHLSYISFKIAPLWKYAVLPATVNALETYLEAILQKPFELFDAFLMTPEESQKLLPFIGGCSRGNSSRSEAKRLWRMVQCCHIVPC